MISCLSWVPKGVARERPVRFELSAEEYARVKTLALAEEVEESELVRSEEISTLQKDEYSGNVGEVDNELPAELRMDEYDDEDDEPELIAYDDDVDMEEDDIQLLEEGETALAMVDNFGNDHKGEDDASDEDEEDDRIHKTDSLLVIAMTEDDFSHLEVQLLSEDGSLFVHHDITLPDFPLSLAWMDCPPFLATEGQQLAVGNYMAVGTFNPAIEIWNLDVLDPLEPTAVLGGADPNAPPVKGKGKKKKRDKEPSLKEGSHSQAVMTLSWNTVFRQLLASGSADHSVKIWDVTTQTCKHTFTHHTDKVQSVLWHPSSAWVLASGSFDRRVCVCDCRKGSSSPPILSAALPADVEAMAWNPFRAEHLYISLEDGQVGILDASLAIGEQKAEATAAGEVRCFKAHKGAVSALSFSACVRGLLATCGTDKTVRVWDVSALSDYAEAEPKLVAYKSMNVGKLFTLQFSPDVPFLLATAGDKGMIAVWESDEQEAIRVHFEDRVVSGNDVYVDLLKPDLRVEDILPQAESGQAEIVVDEAWMDDPAGIETGRVQGTAKNKKVKKNKKKI